MALITNKSFAEQNRATHRFRDTVGYENVGFLTMPQAPVYAPMVCEPSVGTRDGTLHMLRAPQSPEDNAVGEAMSWDGQKREWIPLLGAGRRLAFSSAYLAAHGWMYAGPVDPEKLVEKQKLEGWTALEE
jgi:hypothetical protein